MSRRNGDIWRSAQNGLPVITFNPSCFAGFAGRFIAYLKMKEAVMTPTNRVPGGWYQSSPPERRFDGLKRHPSIRKN
jgi:hypothetical protein